AYQLRKRRRRRRRGRDHLPPGLVRPVNPLDAGPAALAPPRPQTAQAELEFARDANGATYVHRQRVGYPFHVGRSLKMPGDPPGMPTLYLQSCSGGIFEGDDLRLRISA